MASADGQLRASVIGGGIALAIGVAAVRFCGSVPLPLRLASATISESGPVPGPVPGPAPGPADDLRAVSASSPAMYLDLLARDATAAGLPKPTLEEMSRKLPFRMDEGRHVLEVGQRPIEVAGLKLARCARAMRSGWRSGTRRGRTSRTW